MKKTFLALFFIVSVGELASQFIAHASTLHHICKPLIMVTLAGWYLFSVAREYRSASLVFAMVFSFLGDSFLMYQDRNGMYFMLGLGAFLVSHIFYIFAYRQHQSEATGDELQGIQKIRLSFPIMLAGSGLVVILYPTLGDLKVPVMIYALVLVLMVMNALFRYGRTRSKSFWMVFAGALLFMISDSLIAIHKFYAPVQHEGLWIMGTYITAQFLIVSGLVQHDRR
ncbi:MAG: lysoplasmalogenase [Cyclobacteriaceae bacterium]|nr:lysoplasmalogenase [Cyclobacteriaceae bacterium]